MNLFGDSGTFEAGTENKTLPSYGLNNVESTLGKYTFVYYTYFQRVII